MPLAKIFSLLSCGFRPCGPVVRVVSPRHEPRDGHPARNATAGQEATPAMLFTCVIEGNLASDPVLRTTDKGHTVANFRIIHNSRYRNAAGDYVDGKAVSIEVACWRKLAEHAAAGLRKGDTVTVEFADLRAYANGQYSNLAGTATNVSVSMRWAAAASAKSRPEISRPRVDSVGDAWTAGASPESDGVESFTADRELTDAF